MAKFHYSGCNRIYESDERKGFKFRLEVSFKNDFFLLCVKDTYSHGKPYRKVCRLFNSQKILKFLGYSQKDFMHNMNCHNFMHDLHILKRDVDRYSTFTYRRFKECIY